MVSTLSSSLNKKVAENGNVAGLKLYSVFHCNLAYSSIHEEDHGIVLDNCYWPLLELYEKYGLPFGIELTGITLSRIAELDSAWITKLKELNRKGMCDFLASGYAQVIGPLVPQKVNEKNLEAGLQVYEDILGIRPKIAYVNEQAFSSGLADVYIGMGFDAIFMEWNNVYSANNGSWNSEWQYYPQSVISASGRTIPVIWNNAVSFQRLQRYIHGEVTGEEYNRYLESHRGQGDRYLCMYGNDVEIFDFRPGRYHAEAEMEKEGEWTRFEKLVREMNDNSMYSFILPSDTLSTEDEDAFNTLNLSNAASPVPVKKQSKYNITRWALTGRDDTRNNGSCYKLYSMLLSGNGRGAHTSAENNEYWKELCFLWSSDFRTHITDEKYNRFLKRQGMLEYRLDGNRNAKVEANEPAGTCASPSKRIIRDGHYLTVETNATKLSVNSRRGMAIDSLIFKEAGEVPLIGTLHQGYFDDMSLGVDLYSGHVIVQSINYPKITDLAKVEILDKEISGNGFGSAGATAISCSVKTSLGIIHKTIHVYEDKPIIEIEYTFEWNGLKDASFRAGIMTFNPDGFDEETLFYATHNGGPEEQFYLKGHEINHSQSVEQSMITAAHCLGATEGTVRIGDKDKTLIIRADKYPISAGPMIEYHRVDDRFLLRLYHSLGEHDETSYWMWKGRAKWKMSIELEKN